MLTDKDISEILASEIEKCRTHFSQIPAGLRKGDEKVYAPWREHIKAALAAMREVERRSVSTGQQLIAEAIPSMFETCGNSYINAWLQQWLEGAKAAGIYEGPVIGRIVEIDVDHWYELARKNAGNPLST